MCHKGTRVVKSTTDCQVTSHQKKHYQYVPPLTDSQQQLGIRIDYQEISLEARDMTLQACRLSQRAATNLKEA